MEGARCSEKWIWVGRQCCGVGESQIYRSLNPHQPLTPPPSNLASPCQFLPPSLGCIFWLMLKREDPNRNGNRWKFESDGSETEKSGVKLQWSMWFICLVHISFIWSHIYSFGLNMRCGFELNLCSYIIDQCNGPPTRSRSPECPILLVKCIFLAGFTDWQLTISKAHSSLKIWDRHKRLKWRVLDVKKSIALIEI